MRVPRSALSTVAAEIAFAARGPAHAFACGQAGAARGHFHFVGNDEGAVEADAELADQLRILLLVAGQLAQEVAGAGLGNRAQVGDGFGAAHANAVVVDGDGVGGGIEADAHAQFAVAFQQRRLGQGLSAACRRRRRRWRPARGGRFPCWVQRVDHQLQQLLTSVWKPRVSVWVVSVIGKAPCAMPRQRAASPRVGVIVPKSRGWLAGCARTQRPKQQQQQQQQQQQRKAIRGMAGRCGLAGHAVNPSWGSMAPSMAPTVLPTHTARL